MRTYQVANLVVFILILIMLYQMYGKKWELLEISKTLSPQTLKELQKIIIDNKKKKIIVNGTGSDIVINTSKLTGILRIDEIAKTVSVEAGVSLKNLLSVLASRGLTLDCIPTNLEQSVTQACSLGDHGSNLDVGTMSDLVRDLTVVLSNGHIRRIEFDDPEFTSFSTNLGCLCCVYSITLSCVDIYIVETNKVSGDWNSIKRNLFENLEKYPMTEIHINCSDSQTSCSFGRKNTNGKSEDKLPVPISVTSVIENESSDSECRRRHQGAPCGLCCHGIQLYRGQYGLGSG